MSRWSRHAMLVVGAAVLLGLATLVGGVARTDVPAPVRSAFEAAVDRDQASSVAPDAGGADGFDYTSYRGTSRAAELEATVRLWSDDGTGRLEQPTTVTAGLERRGDGSWVVVRSRVRPD